jgi:small subunit ribosomal protein S6
MLIITPDYEENEAEALIENVKGIIEGGGNLINIDVWRKRRLAYPIRKHSEGYYVVYVFESESSFIAELNQALRVIEAILRHMIVLYEDDVEKLKAAQDEAAMPEVSDADTAEDTTESVEDSAESVEDTAESV